jgi:hypothetical protein
METGISINKHLYSILKSNDKINEYVNGNIYPIVAEEDTKFPFITFTKTDVFGSYSKDGWEYDTVPFTVSIVANDYITTVEIAEIVRNLFDWRHNSYFKKVEFKGCTESYSNSVYVQTLNFSATI